MSKQPRKEAKPSEKTGTVSWDCSFCLCNVLVKISTWIFKQSYSRVRTEKTQSVSAETQLPSTLQNNLYENIRIPVTLKYQSYSSFIRPYVIHLFYKWQLEQKLEQPHCSHILEGVTVLHQSTQMTESLSPFYILYLAVSTFGTYK